MTHCVCGHQFWIQLPMSDFSPQQISFDQNQLIEASAGTGKTYTITNLVLRLLLGRDTPWQRPLAISEILVLTFTIAATDELKHRVAKRIKEARSAFRHGTEDGFLQVLIDGSDDPKKDIKLLTAANQLMDEASIFTIHGFCARVLGEQAFESGGLFSQELNAERDQLLQLAAEDCFRRYIMPLPADERQIALSIWSNPDVLARKASNYLFRGSLRLNPQYDPEVTIEGVMNNVARVQKSWINEDIESLLTSSDLKKGSQPIKRLSQMMTACQDESLDLDSELWQIYAREKLTSSTKKNGNTPEHEVLDLISSINQDLPVVRSNLWHEMLGHISTLMTSHKQNWNKLTIDDLLSALETAVNEPESSLPETIAARWPIAMIDEFQDTDTIQHSIFSRVYNNSDHRTQQQTLLMIGDPKQAIYNFRGADVYTYINTKRGLTKPHNLNTNWRSTPALITATNRLFSQTEIFGNDSDIPFQPVLPAEPNAAMQITLEGKLCTPYQLFVAEDPEKFANIGEISEALMNHAAEQTVKLINGKHEAMVDDQPVNAGQIAFLVRRRKDAQLAQEALAARGVQSVYLTLDSVFLEDTAADLKLMLEAVLEPGNDQAIRAALASRLMQGAADEIDRLNHDVVLQQSVLIEFREYHRNWLENGIAPMMNAFIVRRGLAEKWLAQRDGERQMTNLRHLIEILQKQSELFPGMYQLIKWFGHEQQDAETVSSEERQLRLESDENLVKIVTMHAAKGLEYDIVMLPMPVFSKPKRSNQDPMLYHQEIENQYLAAVELAGDKENRNAGLREEFDEDMRLLYVALTRARYRCYIGMPKIQHFASSAVAKLFGQQDLKKPDSLLALIEQTLPTELFEIVAADSSNITAYIDHSRASTLSPPQSRPIVADSWRVHSYTAVAARLTAPQDPLQVTGYSDDDKSEGEATASTLNRFNFPRGPRVGVVLHSLMEDIDFADSIEHSRLCQRTLTRLGLDEEWAPVLESWLADMLAAPMGDHCLADISRPERLDEMEFHFPVSASGGLLKFLTDNGLIDSGNQNSLKLDGLMTGLVDLLYRREDRYYIVDYKSNYLGSTLESYSPGLLGQAMTSHQYHLQYLIYTVALHRMLKQKLQDYDYETHIGGVYYLFLRGLNPENACGVYQTKPQRALIEQLDSLLAGT